jgi:hypothetical protein
MNLRLPSKMAATGSSAGEIYRRGVGLSRKRFQLAKTAISDCGASVRGPNA